jgi:alpha-1,2-mannosyltransferase
VAEPTAPDVAAPRPAATRLAAAGRALPVVALAVLALGLGLTLAVAGDTWGYDFAAYRDAALRLVDGEPLYDPAVDVAGGYAIYLYPPPFAILVLPFAVLPEPLGLWAWTALLVAAFLAGTGLLPVGVRTRWLVVLLGGLIWPLLYSIKLGQVGPLLYLGFAAGWRWMDVPVRLGAAMALGTIVKLQPALLFGWAVATRRWRAAAIGLVVLGVAALVATLVAGPGTWADYVALLTRVNDPVMTPHNFTPGAIAFQAGLPADAATVLQWAAVGATAVVTLWAWFRADAQRSYLVTVVASQLVSPLLWDHYAMLLLLPVAWLLERRRWWAALVPLALAWPAVAITPPVAYPLAFAVCLVAPLLVARGSPAAPGPAGQPGSPVEPRSP